MLSLVIFFILQATLARAASNVQTRKITVDAGVVTGQFKNLQGTNNCDVPNANDDLDNIHDATPAVQQHWRDSAVKHVMIYTFPDVFLGGDPYDSANYNFTASDMRVRYVVEGGAVASAQFQEGGDITDLTPAELEGIGPRNGANNSGFSNAVELWDFYPEGDKEYYTTESTSYKENLAAYSAFARGVAKANNPNVGCGAWGFKRMWTPTASYTLPDPWKTEFFADIVAAGVPIKAATMHWDSTLFSWNSYELVPGVKQFRELYLAPNGLGDLPIWITEHNRNPLGTLPTTKAALEAYWDPASFAAWVISVAMYGQDADVEQVMSWTGLGYGGYGYGDAYFQAWYTNTSNGDVATNAGAAWVLSGQFVTETANRLALTGSSPDGFTALAGISDEEDQVQIMLNNYQVDYDILRQNTVQLITELDVNVSASPITQENGLFNGEQACFTFDDNAVLGCTTFMQPIIRDNHATAYALEVKNLPWSSSTKYTAEIIMVDIVYLK
ncbi:hypothetical protein ASPZODRAFT_142343 [Penicilliopsis zonata CBS 506.65]|uniref:Uncharacterized protein n=1 Tax=Penicilliopsis zonata CBS 506.65 TaxID=1073090 RepID=A0A1L9SH97_9EURO|nr:hypothetical protein ASPZODRAFT_142343 [Penicilliopsis zonata CBS 506.65]OJJ46531.1 hypothetical protein ASPZODRAFT_142343 [Penicilliopsis zonata CBS 506.65]